MSTRLKNVLGLSVIAVLLFTYGMVVWGALRPPPVEAPVLVEVPIERPVECITFDLLAPGDYGFVRMAQQELCGQALTWGRALGPSLDEALVSAENERDAWRDCALDVALCATWQKEWK